MEQQIIDSINLDNNAVWALVGVHVLQWLKETSLIKQVSEKTDVLNKFLSALWAFATGLGLTIATQGDLMQGATVTVTLPALTVLVKNFLLNYGMQQTYYRKVVKKTHDG